MSSYPQVPEYLPGEPVKPRPGALLLAWRLLGGALGLLLLLALTSPLWPLYALGCLVWGVPPNVMRLPRILRYLRYTFTAQPPPPGLPAARRAWILLLVLRKLAALPFWGLAWQLDELLYGRRLDAVELRAPLLEISAARSGSTQLARYLEDDPEIRAPAMLQFVFPYLWLWRLAPRTIGRFFTAARLRQQMEARLPREFLERHEADPLRTDTFELALFTPHLNFLSLSFGPEIAAQEMGFVGSPQNRQLWEGIFVDLLERLGRKTLLYAGRLPDGRWPRLMVKGHFLAAAPALELRFPDARFLTVLREPAPRLQSTLNFLRARPSDDVLGPTPWSWLAELLVRTEVPYCEREQDWYTQTGAARCVIRFQDYVRDLEGTLRKIYRECLDAEALPPHVPRVHAPRVRHGYLLDRSLEQVGIDVPALNAQLEAYIAWCRDEEDPRRAGS
jgi:hypothetical protein